jgi:hypothetical protein
MIRLAVLGLLLALVACGGEEVGRICDLGVEAPGANQAVVASPSLDCLTRTCLKIPKTNPSLPAGSRYPEGNKGLCTAECEASDDCERVPESPCQTGFTCGVAVTVGPFCCKRFCICKDYIVLPMDGMLDDPLACDPDNMNNTCQNLPGRM